MCKTLNPDGTENEAASFIGNINPYRYRSYYYDAEIGLYYLQSRYYDADVGRFVNGDEACLLFFSQYGVLWNNLYVYCENNVITSVDYRGYIKINIQWVWWTVDGLIWLIPALFSIAKIWSTVSRSANRLYNFGLSLISYGKKLLSKLDDRLYWAFAKDSSYRIIKTIGVLAGFATIFFSIGVMVQYIIDILDGKWDGYLNTGNIRPALDLTKDY